MQPHQDDDHDVKDVHRNGQTFDQLVERLYTDLRSLASRVRWRGPQVTQPTSLLHDAYLKLRKSKDSASISKEEIIQVFAHVMRQVMIDAARRTRAGKRGGGVQAVPLLQDDLPGIQHTPGKSAISPEDLLALDIALKELRRENPRQARVVDCRYFLGMTVAETALALDVAETTIEREWREGRRYLGAKLHPPEK